jgi:hypothetical protein
MNANTDATAIAATVTLENRGIVGRTLTLREQNS